MWYKGVYAINKLLVRNYNDMSIVEKQKISFFSNCQQWLAILSNPKSKS